MSSVWPYHFVCGVLYLSVFHGFLLVYSFFFPFMFNNLRNWLGKKKVNGTRGEMNESQHGGPR